MASSIILAIAIGSAHGQVKNGVPPFPELAEKLKTHWIDGDTLFYIKGDTIALREIETGLETYMPYGDYDIKSLFVRGNEIALTAKTRETFWDDFLSWIQFQYDAENDIYNGIICQINTARCEVKVSGNYLMRDFQPFQKGYVFAKSEWSSDYAFIADSPSEFRSMLVFLVDGRSTQSPNSKIGGVRSLFAIGDSVFVDIHNARHDEFPSGAGVYQWKKDGLFRISLMVLNDRYDEGGFNGRYYDLGGGVLQTDGRNWMLSFYDVYDGKMVDFNNRGVCGRYLKIDKTKSAVFYQNSVFVYIGGDLKKHAVTCF